LKKIIEYDWSISHDLRLTTLIIDRGLRYVHYRFLALAINFKTQSLWTFYDCKIVFIFLFIV